MIGEFIFLGVFLVAFVFALRKDYYSGHTDEESEEE